MTSAPSLTSTTMTSIVVPIGYSGSSCGYCGEHGKRSAGKNSYSYGFWAVQLSCNDFKNLIDTGWRGCRLLL